MNKGKGMWVIGAWVLGLAQVVVIAVGTKLINDIERINQAIQVGQKVDIEIDQRLKFLEAKK